jgi:starch synthase/alpha-amylase
VAIYDFDFHLEHQAYAACDFILMPSSFEPCGLPQMIAPLYGTLPVAHDTGGIHDTISHLDVAQNSGNGFLFKNFDSGGLWWAIEQAMHFYNLPKATKGKQIRRIMQESAAAFTHANTARQYIKLYEKMLKRPLFLQNVPNPGSQEKSARP